MKIQLKIESPGYGTNFGTEPMKIEEKRKLFHKVLEIGFLSKPRKTQLTIRSKLTKFCICVNYIIYTISVVLG